MYFTYIYFKVCYYSIILFRRSIEEVVIAHREYIVHHVDDDAGDKAFGLVPYEADDKRRSDDDRKQDDVQVPARKDEGADDDSKVWPFFLDIKVYIYPRKNSSSPMGAISPAPISSRI